MNKRIGFISLGCSKNLVDTEIMIGLCQEAGFVVETESKLAEIIVINTCGFIDSAKEEAIETILDTAKLKKSGMLKKIVVTGCLVQRYKEDILNEFPEVDCIIGIDEFPNIVNILNQERKYVVSGNQALYPETSPRILSTPSYRAFLKISEGCNNKCTYCAIPSIRGPYRSRKIEDVLKEAATLFNNGVKELSVIAQDTTYYGYDLYGKNELPYLLEKLSEIGFPWIRIFYTYAERIDDTLLEVIEKHENILPYLDIPIQHIDNSILRKMGRKDTRESILNLLNKLKKKIPEITLRTSLIVGFPGETEEAFISLCEFVNLGLFDRIGVFKYSPEEGTPASRLPDQIDDETKELRYNKLMEIANTISQKACEKKIGTYQQVICEGFEDLFYIGRSTGDGVDVDGLVYFTSKDEIAPGSIVNVKILAAEEYDLIGVVENEYTE